MIKDDSKQFGEFIKRIKKAEEDVNKIIIETPARNIEIFRQRTHDAVNSIKVNLVTKTYDYAKQETETAYKDGTEEAEKVIKPPTQVTPQSIQSPKSIVANTYLELANNITVASQNAVDIVNNAIDEVQRQGKLATVSMVRDKIRETLIAENGSGMNVQYKDGKKVSVTAYSEMLARTSRISTANEGMVNRTQELGRDLVICTEIQSTCPICKKYEGKVYSISGNDKRFPPLYDSPNSPFQNGYSIIHPNCRHEFLPFIEELHDNDIKELQKKSNRFENYDKNDRIFAAYREQQAKLRQYRNEYIEYHDMKNTLGKDMPYKTIGGFRRAKRADNTEYTQAHRILAVSQKKAEIQQGGYNLTVETGKQGKHIVGHNNYKDNKSVLTIPIEQVQEIVNKTAGTGRLLYTKNEERFTNKELIVYNSVVGKVKNINGEWEETNKFTIHYAKNGVHIVPTLREIKK
jgi:hypothetical protein